MSRQGPPICQNHGEADAKGQFATPYLQSLPPRPGSRLQGGQLVFLVMPAAAVAVCSPHNGGADRGASEGRPQCLLHLVEVEELFGWSHACFFFKKYFLNS